MAGTFLGTFLGTAVQWKKGTLPHPYGIEWPQVLFVVDSPNADQRIANVIEKAATFGVAQDSPNLFLFAPLQGYLQSSLGDPIWLNLKGAEKALVGVE